MKASDDSKPFKFQPPFRAEILDLLGPKNKKKNINFINRIEESIGHYNRNKFFSRFTPISEKQELLNQIKTKTKQLQLLIQKISVDDDTEDSIITPQYYPIFMDIFETLLEEIPPSLSKEDRSNEEFNAWQYTYRVSKNLSDFIPILDKVIKKIGKPKKGDQTNRDYQIDCFTNEIQIEYLIEFRRLPVATRGNNFCKAIKKIYDLLELKADPHIRLKKNKSVIESIPRLQKIISEQTK